MASQSTMRVSPLFSPVKRESRGVRVGGTVSWTRMLRVKLPVLPQSSVALQTTCCHWRKPSVSQSRGTRAEMMVVSRLSSQLSEALTSLRSKAGMASQSTMRVSPLFSPMKRESRGVRVGGRVSPTEKVAVRESTLPHSSVARKVTVVLALQGSLRSRVGFGGSVLQAKSRQKSVASAKPLLASHSSKASWAPSTQSKCTFMGSTRKTGAVVSVKKMVACRSALLPQASVAVKVTTSLPSPLTQGPSSPSKSFVTVSGMLTSEMQVVEMNSSQSCMICGASGSLQSRCRSLSWAMVSHMGGMSSTMV